MRATARDDEMKALIRSTIALEILGYLLDNPGAKDTLEGITRFWITRKKVDLLLEETELVLKELVQSGYLREEVVNDLANGTGERCYALCPDKEKEIRRLLS